MLKRKPINDLMIQAYLLLTDGLDLRELIDIQMAYWLHSSKIITLERILAAGNLATVLEDDTEIEHLVLSVFMLGAVNDQSLRILQDCYAILVALDHKDQISVGRDNKIVELMRMNLTEEQFNKIVEP